MSESIPNLPAFPSEQHETQDGAWNQTFDSGMSLRDYLAAKAMQGWLSNPNFTEDYIESKEPGELADSSYRIADAMLAERSKPTTK